MNRVQEISIELKDTKIDGTQSSKYLSVILHRSTSWADHVAAITGKIIQRIGLTRRVRNLLPLETRVTLYNILIL